MANDQAPGNRLPELSNELRAFIASYIPSVIRLEVLLLVFEDQFSAWTAHEVDRKLDLPCGSASFHLDQLVSQGLVARDTQNENRYIFCSASDELAVTVRELCNAYTTQRVAVLSMIFANPVDKVRLFTETFRMIQGDSETNTIE